VDPKTVLASSTARPADTFTIYDFSILPGKASATAPELVQCLSDKDPGCVSDQVMIPILDRTSGLDLRGKTLQIMTTRAFAGAGRGSEAEREVEAIWNRLVRKRGFRAIDTSDS